MSVGDRILDHVWVVNLPEEYDGIFVFEDEAPARKFAKRYQLASVTEEVVMNPAAAKKFLRDTKDG